MADNIVSNVVVIYTLDLDVEFSIEGQLTNSSPYFHRNEVQFNINWWDYSIADNGTNFERGYPEVINGEGTIDGFPLKKAEEE